MYCGSFVMPCGCGTYLSHRMLPFGAKKKKNQKKWKKGAILGKCYQNYCLTTAAEDVLSFEFSVSFIPFGFFSSWAAWVFDWWLVVSTSLIVHIALFVIVVTTGSHVIEYLCLPALGIGWVLEDPSPLLAEINAGNGWLVSSNLGWDCFGSSILGHRTMGPTRTESWVWLTITSIISCSEMFSLQSRACSSSCDFGVFNPCKPTFSAFWLVTSLS